MANHEIEGQVTPLRHWSDELKTSHVFSAPAFPPDEQEFAKSVALNALDTIKAKFNALRGALGGATAARVVAAYINHLIPNEGIAIEVVSKPQETLES